MKEGFIASSPRSRQNASKFTRFFSVAFNSVLTYRAMIFGPRSGSEQTCFPVAAVTACDGWWMPPTFLSAVG